MKFQRKYFFGGNKRDGHEDYIISYVGENGIEIEVKRGFSNWNQQWYEVNGKFFDTLVDAKEYVSKIK